MAEALPVQRNGSSTNKETPLDDYQEQYITDESIVEELQLECSSKETSKKLGVFTSVKVCSHRNSLRLETLEKKRKACEVLFEDILGVQIIDNPTPESNPACTVDVHSFKNTSKKLGTGDTDRNHEKLIIRFSTGKSFEENQSRAKKWKEAVLNLSRQRCRETFIYDNPHERQDVHNPHYLVLINPVGGKGKAEMLFHKEVQPMFDIAEITYEAVVTERQGHAKDLVQTYDLSAIDGIVISGGDGLLYEVVNGLMKRPDWRQAIATPIGIIPTGSGNALASCVMHGSRESLSVQNAAFHIIRGGVQPMDLAVADTADGDRSYFSVVVGWALISDSDIESEKWRSWGELRLQLGAFISIVKKRLYQGRLWYLPADSEDDDSTSQTLSVPAATAAKQGMDGQRVAERLEQAKPNGEPFSGGDDDNECNETPSQETKTAHSNSHSEAVSEPNVLVENGSPSQELNPRYLVDPASTPTHPWKLIEGEFYLLMVITMTHIGHKMYAAVDGKIGGGVFHIYYTIGDAPRSKVLNDLLGFEKGLTPDGRYTHMLKAKAFRLAPVTQGTRLLTLDGEMIPYGDLQCEMFQGLCRVMSRTRRK